MAYPQGMFGKAIIWGEPDGDVQAVSADATLTASTATFADMEQARFAGTDPRRPTYQEAKRLPTMRRRTRTRAGVATS